jgi:energy-coupling factor transport system ATP-binding protein
MITLTNLTYSYPDAAQPVFEQLNVTLPAGSFTLMVGSSGSGKSTLLRCIAGLTPFFRGGTLGGSLLVAGHDPLRLGPGAMSQYVGSVFQDPERQAVLDRVEDEIAFPLEQAGMARHAMRLRVEEVLHLLDLTALRQRKLETLSGGERQRVLIAAALALRPTILVLDEPTSQLDPQSADDVLQALVRLNHDLGLTIVLAEHRLERVLPFADQVLYLPGAAAPPILGSPAEVLPQSDLVPPLLELGQALGWQPLPLTIRAGLQLSQQLVIGPQPVRPTLLPIGEPLLHIERLEAGYHGRSVLCETTLSLWPGEVLAVFGRNGVGKSTLLKTIVGLVRAEHGQIVWNGQPINDWPTERICREIAYLPQDSDALLFADQVCDEIAFTLRSRGVALAEHAERIEYLLQQLGLERYATLYPRDLSVGERQRVALAAVVAGNVRALLLDEPTRGLDYQAKQQLVTLLRAWRTAGMAILVVTHDVEFAALLADRAVVLGQGEVVASGTIAEVLGSSPLFAPQVARLFPGTGWLTVAEALAGLRAV